MNWEDVAPVPVARAQLAWERAMLVRRLHQAGLSYGAIGVHLGVCRARAFQLGVRPVPKTPPIMKWASLERAVSYVVLSLKEPPVGKKRAAWHAKTLEDY